MTKLFIGAVSKNTVDTVIEYANDNNVKLGLIPSRRQIDYDSGYVNNWITNEFAVYVKRRMKNYNVILQRDHGGHKQGDSNHFISYGTDVKHFQGIHIDPFKSANEWGESIYESAATAAVQTARDIVYCEDERWVSNLWFEVGTEEAIHFMDDADLWTFLHVLKDNLPTVLFKKIKYVVVQSGTRLLGNENIGTFDQKRLENMVGVAHEYGLLAKIHNGDYLSLNELKQHYEIADAINIAPEFGYLETKTYLEYMHNGQFDRFYRLCYDSDQWKKWVDDKFNPRHNKQNLVEICGHYVFSTPEFLEIKSELPKEIDEFVKDRLYKRIGDILNV